MVVITAADWGRVILGAEYPLGRGTTRGLALALADRGPKKARAGRLLAGST